MSFSSSPEALEAMPDLQTVGLGFGTACRMLLGRRRRALLGLSPYSNGEGAGPARRVKNRLRAAGCGEEGDRPTHVGGLFPFPRTAAPCEEKVRKLR